MQPSARDVRSELDAISASIAIESVAAFTFAGRRFTVPGERSPEEMRATMLATMQEQLYRHCFCRRFAGAIEDDPPPSENDDFGKELSAANTGRLRWSDGWSIVGIETNGKITAHLNGAMRSFWPGEYLVHDLPGSPPRVGASTRVHVVTESFAMQPGFYFVFGESLEDRRDGIDYVRFYWSIGAAAAPTLIRALTARFNRFAVPFRLKCLTHRAQYMRLDPAVLYVDRRFYRIAAELASEVHARVRRDARSTSPLFTKQLAPGLALAEDPGNAESFGMHRCSILAEGLLKAHARGATGERRLAVLEEQFARHDLSLARPYLNPGSIDDYAYRSAPPESG